MTYNNYENDFDNRGQEDTEQVEQAFQVQSGLGGGILSSGSARGGGEVPPEPPREDWDSPRRGKRPRKGPGWGALVAMGLCCALAGGLVGGGLANVIQEDENQPAQITTAPAGASTAVSNPTGDVMAAGDIYDMACQQVVGVTTEITYTNWFGQTSSSAVSGSGFIISEDGYILTNYHVIESAVEGGYDISVILHDNTEYVAKVVGCEPDNDVAVLKIDASGLNAATVGNSDDLQVGETVYAVGNPLGELAYTMTTGSISALDRAITTESYAVPVNMFQLDAAVNSGNSGGPVYNSLGQVVGIVTAKNGDSGVEGLGFAIPINDAVEIANSLIENGYVTGKAYLGITGGTVSETVAEYYNLVPGALVSTVTEGGAAARAGLAYGDIITQLGDYTVDSWDSLNTAVREYHAGDTVTVEFYRNGQKQSVELTFDERPSNEELQQAQSQEQGQEQGDRQQYQIPNMDDFMDSFFGGQH